MIDNEIEIYSDKKLNLLAKCVYERILKGELKQYDSRRVGIKQQVEVLIQDYQREIKCCLHL